MDRLAQDIVLSHQIFSRFKLAQIAKNFDDLLGLIERDGKKAVAESKTFPARWKHSVEMSYKAVLAEHDTGGAALKELEADAKSMRDAMMKEIDKMAANWSLPAAEEAGKVPFMHHWQEKGYWDPEWAADDDNAKHPLEPLTSACHVVYEDYKTSWGELVSLYTPGELHRTLYAMTPKDFHPQVNTLSNKFFGDAVKGDIRSALRGLWADVKKLSVTAKDSASPVGMSPEDASWELKQQAEKANDQWTRDFAKQVAEMYMRKKTPSFKQLALLKDKLHRYNIGPVHGL